GPGPHQGEHRPRRRDRRPEGCVCRRRHPPRGAPLDPLRPRMGLRPANRTREPVAHVADPRRARPRGHPAGARRPDRPARGRVRQYVRDTYGAGLWVFENMADILAHPNAYKIPCLWEKPMAPSKVFGEGESFSWRGTTFRATKTPGHTEYHCALSFEVDGRRI